MKPFRLIQPFLLLILMQMGCRNTVSPEFGELTLNIEWSDLEKIQALKLSHTPLLKTADSEPMKNPDKTLSVSSQSDTLPEVSMVRITLEPGPIVHEFTEVLPVYSIQAELGIYNVLVEVINQHGHVIFSADTSEILIRPPNQIQITLRITPNYPTSAPEFTGWESMNPMNAAAYSLNWTHVAKADSFELEESKASDFASSDRIYSGSDTSFEITGQPDGTYYYRVRAKNSLATSPWSQVIGFQVAVAESLKLLSTTLPEGIFGVQYEAGICFSGGTAPYDWELVDSELPPGLIASLSDSCIIITGIPTLQGQFPLIIDIEDSGYPEQWVTFDGYINIVPPDIEILNVNLADGQADQEYSECYAPPDNLASYQWTLSDYPDWITVDIGTEICYSGTPDIEGDYSWMAQGYDPGNPQTQTQIIFSLHVASAQPDLSISTTTLDSGAENQFYEASICAEGGKAPYTYSIIQGDLADGLTTTSATCLEISGTPAESGIFSFTVEVMDSNEPPATAQKAFILDIEPAPPALQIITDTVPDGYLESFYTQSVCATDGVLPYTWSVSQGELPEGLAIEYEEDGACVTITGTPETQGDYTLTLQVTDSSDPAMQADKAYHLMIHPPVLHIVTELLPPGRIDVEYNQAVCAENGTPPYQWEITEGSLPQGLETNMEECLYFTGTPGETGDFPITVQVSDQSEPAQTHQQAYILTIEPPLLWISTNQIPDGIQGTYYSANIEAHGGSGDWSWHLCSGSLPPGMTLNDNGDHATVRGTPGTAGTYTFSVQVTDNIYTGLFETKRFSLTIGEVAPFRIITTSLSNATVYDYYTDYLCAADGILPYSWDVISGSLPPDLYTGAPINECVDISGIPNSVGVHAFTVRVTDSDSPPKIHTRAFSITVNPEPLVIYTDSPLPEGQYLEGGYEALICATGGTADYSWSMTGGALPAGLSFSDWGECARVTGTPTETGTFSITVRVTDNNYPLSDTKVFGLTITNP
ncbi:putative Ig domain-containing protein [bacterium]|nr:putative Ig domain-containing protein [bacterium]